MKNNKSGEGKRKTNLAPSQDENDQREMRGSLEEERGWSEDEKNSKINLNVSRVKHRKTRALTKRD